MDWKTFYRAELESPAAHGLLEACFLEGAHVEPLHHLLNRGAVLSFPHTAMRFAGPIQANVVTALYRCEFERVIALGALHSSSLPDPYRGFDQAVLNENLPVDRRSEAFLSLTGGILPGATSAVTPFGTLPFLPLPEELCEVVRPEPLHLLEQEFSLDTFFSLVRFYADWRGTDPLPVLPVYIGMTRDPISGSFDVARRLAASLRKVHDSRTAIVATGDLVHYGTAYSDREAAAARSADAAALHTHFRREVERTLDLALIERRDADAFRSSEQVLKSDQRHLLPVLAGLVRPNGQYEILHFELSDYAPIFGSGPPCVVASALVAFLPGVGHRRVGRIDETDER